MFKTFAVAAAALAITLSLAGCQSIIDKLGPISTQPQPAASAPAVPSAPDAAKTAVRQLSSPGHVTDDMQLSAGQCHAVTVNAANGDFLPDPSCTPGAADTAVTQANLASTICASGYTKTIRPPVSETGRAKYLSLAQYNLAYSKTTEYDHLISLELGGTNSTSNLWPEPNSSSAASFNNPKDAVENALNAAICSHKVTLVAAQNAIASNWITAEHVLGLN